MGRRLLPKEQIDQNRYYDDRSSHVCRCYQSNAINNTVEAEAKSQQRVLLVMATGTGKTYTAFEIIWCLWKLGDNLRVQNNLSQ